jgi:SPP1 gp7 family putative phage head morphogenesis protein
MTPKPPPLDPYVEKKIRELLRVYRTAARDIERQLSKAALTSFASFRLGAHLREIKDIVAALNAEARDVARKVSPLCYQTGADLTADVLTEAGVKMAGFDIGNRIHTAAVQAVTDQMTQDLLIANGSLKGQATRILRLCQQKAIDERQINQIIAQGIVRGETRRDVSQRLTQKLQKAIGEGARVKIVKDGKTYTYAPEYYAEMVARTRTREAVTAGSMRFAEENGVYLFIVSVHDNPCPEICQALQGKVFSIVEGTGFPLLTKRPPFHPHCRHCLIAYIPRDDAERQRLAEFSRSRRIAPSGQDYEAIRAGK